MAGIIPNVGDTGLYGVNTPYNLTPNLSYTCIAIRAFVDLVNAGIDVYSTFYSPIGISMDTYTSDNQYGTVIVVLQGSDGSIVYIPSSYIVATPDQSGVLYRSIVLAMPLGLLPDGFDLSNVITSVNGLIQSMVGVTVTAQVVVTPLTETVTQAQATAIEAGRIGQINNQTSDYALYQQEKAANALLQSRLDAATALLVKAGLVQTQS